MKWLFKYSNLIYYFYIILCIGIIILFDYTLFAVLIQYYDWYLIILLFSLISGLGILFILNSAISRIEQIKNNMKKSIFQYFTFAELLVVIVSGTLIGIPGILNSLLGWIIYFKPIRMLLTKLFMRYHSSLISSLYAYFIIENTQLRKK